jgi:amylosucrase
MGDELGLLNDRSYLTEERLAADNRWLHRPRMPWDVAEQRLVQGTLPARIFGGLAHLARLRARLDALHAAVESEPVDVGVPGLLALRRRHPAGALLQIYNVTDRWQHLPADRVRAAGLATAWEHISGFSPQAELMDGTWIYALPPYAAWWLGSDDA